MSDYMKSLGNTIKKYRKAKNYTTHELAKRLNSSSGTINNIENGRKNVFKLDLLFNLSKELDIPLNELLISKSITLKNLTINPSTNKLEIMLDSKNIENKNILIDQLNNIIINFIECISVYKYNAEAINTISSQLIKEIEYSQKLKTMK